MDDAADKQFWTFVIGGAVVFLVCLPSLVRWWRAERERRASERLARRQQRFGRRRAEVDLARLFGEQVAWTAGMLAPARSSVVRLAELVLPSGRLVACDPLVFADTPPFARSVPPGTYPVDVVNVVPEAGGAMFAALRVTFAPGVPTRWEPADTDAIGDDVGYPVDAGTGCVMSPEAQALLATEMERAGDAYYETVIAPRFEPEAWLDHHPDPARPENVVMVTSGAGDGVYPCWWGLDDNGRVLWFVTDFQVVR